MFKCFNCSKQFKGGQRLDNHVLWQEYTSGKQTYKELATRFGVSTRTIQRRLDKISVTPSFISLSSCVVLMDTTYFGDRGVMVFKSALGQNLYWKHLRNESVAAYMDGLAHLVSKGVRIKAVVCDGKRGLFKALSGYPVQMCQFHQAAIVTRYITRKPKAEAAIELKEIVRLMPSTDKESFFGALKDWHDKWGEYIKERTVNPETGKTRYVHKRLRSAYLSLNRNKAYLFTWYDHMELGIPNTNNKLEGAFTDLKNKLRNHNGLNRIRRERFIDAFLSRK